MGRRRRSCRVCHRPDSETYISKRGLCRSCATTGLVMSLAAHMAAAEALREQRKREGEENDKHP